MIGKIQDIVTAAVVTAAVGNNTQNTVDNGTEQAAAQANAADPSGCGCFRPAACPELGAERHFRRRPLERYRLPA